MKRLLGVIVALVAIPVIVWAANPSPAYWQNTRSSGDGVMYYDAGKGPVLTSMGGLPIINVTDPRYGAKCDGHTDDTAAFTSAFATLRSQTYGVITGPQGKVCRINGTINATMINPSSNPPITSGGPDNEIVVDFGGFLLDCHNTGGVCIDAIGTRDMLWRGLNLAGNSGDTPTIGIQIGRYDPAITADGNRFFGLTIWGSFTQADFANFASEQNPMYGSHIRNFYSGSNAYAIMVDCYNHLNRLTSAFAPLNWSQDTAASCNQISIHGGFIQQTQTSAALWVGGGRDFTVDESTYVASAGPYPQIQYANSSGYVANPSYLDHTEASPGEVSALLITSNQSSVTITGLRMSEAGAQSSFSEVVPDFAAGVTSVNLYASDIRVSKVVSGTFKVYGQYSTFATATVSTGGSGCTNGSQTFTVSGGVGIAATITGTVTGNVLGGALTVTTTGDYQTLPASPATLTGGGCSVAPTITFTTGTDAIARPFTVGGNLTVPAGTNYIVPIDFSLNVHTGTGSVESFRMMGTQVYAVNLAASVAGDNPVCQSAGGQLTQQSNGSFCGAVASFTTASLGGSALTAGQCSTDTEALSNVTTSMTVTASPQTYPGDGNYWVAYPSSSGHVTVKVCAVVNNTPSASVYNVRVIP